MKIKIFAVHDVKAEAFGNPMFMNNEQIAIRGLAGAVADPASVLSQSPEDFNLYELGEYDDNSGLITPLDRPKLVCSALSVVKKYENETE